MKKKLINLGIIGLGEQFLDNILPSLASIHGVRISAVCDINTEALYKCTSRLGATGYNSIKAMIEKEQLDGLVGVSYPQVHKNLLELAFEHKIPVFVEKPPVVSADDLDDILKISCNTPAHVGLNFGYAESVNHVKNIIRQGELGDIVSVRISHCADKPPDTLWGLDYCRSVLLSQAIHPVGTLLEFGDIIDVLSVNCTESPRGLAFDVTIQMNDFGGNVFTANIVTGSLFPYFNWDMEIIGKEGVAKIDSLNELSLKTNSDSKWWSRVWRGSPVMSGSKQAGYRQSLEAFIGEINGHPSTSRNTLRNMVAVYMVLDKMEGAYVGK